MRVHGENAGIATFWVMAGLAVENTGEIGNYCGAALMLRRRIAGVT